MYRILLVILAFMAALQPLSSSAAVNAENYSSFWVWGGVKPQPVLARAENVYILQGEITRIKKNTGFETTLIPQGMGVARIKTGKIWLVYRVNTLQWDENAAAAIVMRLEEWRQSGNPVVGLQIDFDAKTRQLHRYADFLKQLRSRIPAEYKLGITGLLDWSSTGDIKVINKLSGTIDEIIIQTYQGRRTIANYKSYLPPLQRLSIPFKIGLIQYGTWQQEMNIESNPWFRGYVVFLQNRPARQLQGAPEVLGKIYLSR